MERKVIEVIANKTGNNIQSEQSYSFLGNCWATLAAEKTY